MTRFQRGVAGATAVVVAGLVYVACSSGSSGRGGFFLFSDTSQVAGTYNNVTGTLTDSSSNTVAFTSGNLVMGAASTLTYSFSGTTNEAGATNPIAVIGTGTVTLGSGTGPFTGTYSGNYSDAGTIARVVTGNFTLTVAPTGLMTATFASGGSFQGTFSAQGPPPSGGGGGGGLWTTTAVVTTLTAGRLPRVTVDAAGVPHACSLDLTSAAQSYQYHVRGTGGAWTTSNVGSPLSACGGTVGEISDIGVEPNGTVHISFEVPDEAIRVASGGTGGFTLGLATTGICPFPGAQNDESYAFVGQNAIAINPSNGRYYVAAWLTNSSTGGGARTIRVWNSQANANVEVQLGGPGSGAFPDTRTGRSPSIAVGLGGVVHVSYEGFDNALGVDQIRYARSNNNGNTFTTHLVASVGNGNDGWETRIASDPAGYPHVVYYEPGVGYRHAISVDNGQTWTIDTIAAVSVGAGTAWIDLSIDAGNRVHVVYNGGTGAAVTYQRNTGAVWSAAESVSTDGLQPSIAAHTDGTSHVVYRGAAGGLFHATRAP